MAAVTIRNLPEETHRALKLRAAAMGAARSLRFASSCKKPSPRNRRMKIGSELAAFGRRYGGIELNYKRDRRPIEPAEFE